MLTSKVREILCKADVGEGVLNNVPLNILSELVSLRIVDEQWRHSGDAIVGGGTAGAPSTHVDRVKLTSAGVRLACSIQGVEKVRSPG